eukprot:3463002-Ditylum_brightwellii.AAC.1
MGHVQLPTPIMTDNSTACGIINGTVKQRRTRAIDMHFYWVCNCCAQHHFTVYWSPSKNNPGDYYTKHHPAAHHQLMRKVYLYVASPVAYATKLSTPSILQGCVETDKDRLLGPNTQVTSQTPQVPARAQAPQ